MSNSLGDYVAQQTTLEAQRKSAIETKSFSVLTASLALVTIYIALSNQSQLGTDLKASTPRDFLLVALIAAVTAIALAVWAARPVSYQAISTDDLDLTRRALVEIESARPEVGIAPTSEADRTDDIQTQESIADQLVEAQIRDLREARRINTCRAKVLYASLVFLGVQTASLIASLSCAASR
jgi:hypothetical protein